MLFDAQIEDVAHPLFLEAGGGNQGADTGIHREEALERERAKPLGNFSLNQLLLKMKAALCAFLTETLTYVTGNGRDWNH